MADGIITQVLHSPTAARVGARRALDQDTLPLPKLIELEPTENCNLRCVMCHMSYRDFSHRTLDVSRLLSALEGMAGAWVCVGSIFEPTIHPEFGNLMLGLSDLGVHLDLLTNGTVLPATTLAHLARCDIRNVTVSFDGCRKETYESIRRGASYERTLDGIARLRQVVARDDSYFRVHYVVMRRTLDECVEAVDLWESRGFERLAFLPMYTAFEDMKVLDEGLEQHTDRLADALFDAARRVIEGGLRVTLQSPVFAQSHPLKNAYPQHFGDHVRSSHPDAQTRPLPHVQFQRPDSDHPLTKCNSPYQAVRIVSDGRVMLCHDQFEIGNVNASSLREIWYGERAARAREMVETNPQICDNCDYFRVCLASEWSDFTAPATFTAGDTRDAARGIHGFPTLLRRMRGYNIVAWLATYYALPSRYGHLDVRIDDVGSLAGVFVSDRVDEVERYVTHMQPFIGSSLPLEDVSRGSSLFTSDRVTADGP